MSHSRQKSQSPKSEGLLTSLRHYFFGLNAQEEENKTKEERKARHATRKAQDKAIMIKYADGLLKNSDDPVLKRKVQAAVIEDEMSKTLSEMQTQTDKINKDFANPRKP